VQGVDDALSRLDGVEHFTIDLQTNLVEIVVRPGSRFDVAAVPRAVRGAGYRPGWMWVRVVRGGESQVLCLDTRVPGAQWHRGEAPASPPAFDASRPH